MSDSTQNPLSGLKSYAGPVTEMPNQSFGWISPNRLRRDGDHLFIQRDTKLVGEMSEAACLAVIKRNEEVHVYDEHVFMANRWWNYRNHDTYTYPYDYGVYVRSLIVGPERHRDETHDGRIIGNCAWSYQHYTRFAGPLSSLSVHSSGFVDIKQLYHSGNSLYLVDGTTVYPSLEGETCLQVIRFRDGIHIFDGDVPVELRWWDRACPNEPQRNGWPTQVRRLTREQEWRRHFRQAA